VADTVSLRDYVDAMFHERGGQVETALASINQRLALLNELRSNVATKEQLDATHERITELRARIERMDGRSGGILQSWAFLVGAITIAGVIGAILAKHF
jgi:hypothetical protein